MQVHHVVQCMVTRVGTVSLRKQITWNDARPVKEEMNWCARRVVRYSARRVSIFSSARDLVSLFFFFFLPPNNYQHDGEDVRAISSASALFARKTHKTTGVVPRRSSAAHRQSWTTHTRNNCTRLRLTWLTSIEVEKLVQKNLADEEKETNTHR